MKVIRNRLIPFKGFTAINLFGVIFVRNSGMPDDELLNHEAIHTAQQRELGYILFYIIYFFEWLWRLFKPGNAYRQLSFEKEAYENQSNLTYLGSRIRFAQWRNKKDRSGLS